MGGGVDKLKLLRSTKNSGGCAGIPRNTGIRLSRGEYIMFVDSDDAITPTALEELYPIAKKFDADVIHCGKYYEAPIGTAPTDKRLLKESSREHIESIEAPIFESDDITQRIKKFLARGIWWATVSNISRREFIMKEDIFFAKGRLSEDFIFTFQLLCLSKKFLTIPNCYYVYRKRDGSTSRSDNFAPAFHFENWFSPLAEYVEFIDKFMNNFDAFQNNPQFKYMVYDLLFQIHCNKLLEVYTKIPSWQLEGIIRHELEKVDNETAFTAFIFNRMNVFNISMNRQGVMIQQMNAYIQQANAHIQKQNQIIQQLQSQLNQIKS